MDNQESLPKESAEITDETMKQTQAIEMLPKLHKPCKWADMTWEEFRDAVVETRGVVLVPFGCLEKHGNQLPLATDSFVATEVCERAAMMEKAVVFPFSPFGHVAECRHWPGAVSLKSSTLLALLNDLCDELARNGLQKIIFQNGHGGNAPLLRYFQRQSLDTRKPYAVYLASKSWVGDQAKAFAHLMGRDALPEYGHACVIETSEVLALRPETVRMDRVDVSEAHRLNRLGKFKGLPVETPLDWYADYPNHIAGDPSEARAEWGEWLLDLWATNLANVIRLVRDDEMTPHLLDEYYMRCRTLSKA
ncbi:MAG: creatininase family protein [Kiritimatiellia bacterium]